MSNPVPQLRDAANHSRLIAGALRDQAGNLLEQAKSSPCPNKKRELKERAKTLLVNADEYDLDAKRNDQQADNILASDKKKKSGKSHGKDDADNGVK